MKFVVLLILFIASSASYAGTLTIVPDSTSSMGREQQRKEAQAQRSFDRQKRVDAGLEYPAPRVIIVQPPPRPAQLNCYSYGSRGQYTQCQQN